MKAKRVLAAVLCAAMIFSSEAFSMGVMASEVSDPEATPIVTVAEEEEQDETQTPEATEIPDEVQTPEESESPEAEETPETTETPEETEKPEESAEPSESPEGEETPSVSPEEETPSALPEESEKPETEETETPDEMADVVPAESVSSSLDATPEEAEDLTETELVKASSDFFTVDEDGTLRVAEGKEIYGTTVVIPYNATRIPAGIFYEETSVNYIKFEEGSLLTEIDAEAFEYCGVKKIEIPAGVTEIKEGTFKNSSLENITFLGNVTVIGQEAFSDTPLEAITANAVTEVGNNAFSNCSELTDVNMPKLQTIGTKAFQYCTSLNTGMIWSTELATIGKEAFKGCGLTSVDLSGITGEGIQIETKAFENCTKLKTIVLPAGLTGISTGVFKGCTSLKNVTLQENITVIGEEAFSGCTSLETIVIPASVYKILAKAFDGCEALSTIRIENTNPTGSDFSIAQSAFPDKSNNSKVTMKGYDGKVEEYASDKGYTFETLYVKYKIYYYPSDYAKITINQSSAVAGTEIRVNIAPVEGYCLSSEGLQAISNDKSVNVEFISSTDGTQVFGFTMPSGEVTLSASFITVEEAAKGTMKFDFSQVNGYKGEFKDNLLTMEKTGQQTALLVTMNEEQVGTWLLSYKSSNTSVATISDKGVICAKGAGTATITASLKSDSAKKISFKVKVEEDAVISNIELDLGSPARATIKEETIGDETYQVVEYNKSTLASGARTFKVSMKATEENSSTNLVVTSAWTTVDKSIASLSSSKSTDNTNTVTVKKGVEGETMITVTVKNDDETECKESFIVRVIDATPRLADTKISVNSQSTEGTEIDIVPVYGYTINQDSGLRLCKKVTTNGIISYQSLDGFEITETSGQYRIKATDELELKSGNSITYKNSTQLYIRGEFDSTGDTFTIPVTELVVTNKALNPTIKTSGKINLFYNSTASAEEQGSVKVTQSLKDETVEKYELVSAANYKKAGSEEEDTFAANFVISDPAEDGSAVITRSSRETMAQVSGKDVVSGYLYIYYKGYNEPVKKQLKVSTYTSNPSYVLSQTSATASLYRENQEYVLTLRDKKTKEDIVLTEADSLSFDYRKTTNDLFDDDSLEKEISDGKITLKINGTPKKGQAVINVQKSTWSKALQYTFKVSTTTKHPTVKLSASTVVLNTLCPDQAATITATLTPDDDAMITGFDGSTLRYTGNKKYKADAEKLIENMNLSAEGIEVSLPEDIKATTYSFKVSPKIQYVDSDEEYYLKDISFKVTIKNAQPEIKLKSSTFSLNALYPGKETVKTSYSIKNLPEGSTYEIDDSEATLVPVKSSTGALNMKDKVSLTFEDGIVSAQLEDGKYLEAFSYDYYIENLKIVIGEESDNIVTLKKFKIKVKGSVKTASLSVSGKGTLNPVDPISSIVYTAKISNVNSAVEEVKIWEMNENGEYYYDGEDKTPANRTSEHFEVTRDGNKAIVTAKEGATLKAGTSYQIYLAYKLEIDDEDSGYRVTSKPFTIKPKQTLPKIKTDKSTAYLYAGQNRDKDIEVTITQTSVKDAKIVGVDFAKNTSDTIKNAYNIAYDEETGVMKLTLVNPALVVLDTKQTITFETKCENQMENSTGTTFKLAVTVRK